MAEHDRSHPSFDQSTPLPAGLVVRFCSLRHGPATIEVEVLGGAHDGRKRERVLDVEQRMEIETFLTDWIERVNPT